jgi:hypothetical protein
LYFLLQLAKMMFLATFFPASTDEDDELHIGDKELPFDFFTVRNFLGVFFAFIDYVSFEELSAMFVNDFISLNFSGLKPFKIIKILYYVLKALLPWPGIRILWPTEATTSACCIFVTLFEVCYLNLTQRWIENL